METAAKKTIRKPTHPGELLKHDVIPDSGLSVTECARRLRISRSMLNQILSGDRSITAAMALRLGKLFGNGPNLWVNMQVKYDLWHKSEELKQELDSIKTVTA